ncbi:MAG TPA: cytochrome c [Sphingomicrobium sp.]
MRLSVVASFALIAATNAIAAPLSKQAALRIMHERHEGMEAIGKANKSLRREIMADTPNMAAIRSASATVATLANRSARWFPKGTGPEVGKTGAKPEIWQKPADFAAKTRDFQAAGRALHQAAVRGDLAAVKTSYGKLGGTCKACHDPYRSEMH